MTRIITHSPKTDKDLDAFADFLAEESLDLSIRFLDAVDQTEQRLLDMPLSGVLREYNNPRLKGMRMVPTNDFPNHLIFYRPNDTGIYTVRILHGARDIAALFSR